MNQFKLNRLSGRYLAALRFHFEPGAGEDLQAAHNLGNQAVKIGLETLDLARIHERAMVGLGLSGFSSDQQVDMAARAAVFFTEAIAPIEKTHRFAVKADAALNELKTTLAQHTLDLADSNRELQEGIAQRTATEEALKASGDESASLLEESSRMQLHLQEMAQQILTAQENERKAISLKLQDEIAQTLLGIQIRLLVLQKVVVVTDEDFKKEIAKTRRLVEESISTISRFASELGIQHED